NVPPLVRAAWLRYNREMIPGLDVLRGYHRAWLPGDLLAGVTVAAYLVPQVMAYATIAGLPPVTGLWAAFPALIVYALLGSSRSLSMGPEATTALMTLVAIKPLAAGHPVQYAKLASTLALLTGLMALAAWLLRLGFFRRRVAGARVPGQQHRDQDGHRDRRGPQDPGVLTRHGGLRPGRPAGRTPRPVPLPDGGARRDRHLRRAPPDRRAGLPAAARLPPDRAGDRRGGRSRCPGLRHPLRRAGRDRPVSGRPAGPGGPPARRDPGDGARPGRHARRGRLPRRADHPGPSGVPLRRAAVLRQRRGLPAPRPGRRGPGADRKS